MLTSEPDLLVRESAHELITAAAERFVKLSHQAIAERGCFIWSLAGGNTPKALYQLLASPPWRDRIEWESVLIVFGDERAVPPDDERSNYRMARRALLDHVPTSQDNVLRMRGENPDLNAAAREYGLQLKALDAPIDLALLGMGDDGHTASLFPGTPALEETKHRCVMTDVAPLEPHVPRLTLTFPVFNTARHVWILVTGENKAERLHSVLHGPQNISTQPIQGIAPQSGKLTWMLDNPAARLIT